MQDQLDERRQQIADRLLQSTFGLWNALLTVNGILLAAFSATYVVAPSINSSFVLTLIGACAISLVLLVYNFVTTKVTYYHIGQIVTDENGDLSSEQRRRDIDQALFRHKLIQLSEKVCLFLLLIEAGLVMAIAAGISTNAA